MSGPEEGGGERLRARIEEPTQFFDDPVFLGGGARPNHRFGQLCELAGIKPKLDVETGKAIPWLLEDLRNRPHG